MPTGPSSSGYGSECAGNAPSRNTKRGVGVERPITHADVIGCMLDPILETEVLIDGPFAGNSYGGMLTSRDKRHMDYNRNLFEQLRLDPESVSRKQLRYGAFLLQQMQRGNFGMHPRQAQASPAQTSGPMTSQIDMNESVQDLVNRINSSAEPPRFMYKEGRRRRGAGEDRGVQRHDGRDERRQGHDRQRVSRH